MIYADIYVNVVYLNKV
uniref:Uncharacterized protein n=1 Tax=Lepeophtheirus salmonis TaxID=72036 RepID=A0A0K2TYC9_LEPSM